MNEQMREIARCLARYSSRVPHPWHTSLACSMIASALAPGHRVGEALGNRNDQRGKLVDLVDPVGGLAVLGHWLTQGQDLLLLCGCTNRTSCHVKTIVEALCAQMPGMKVMMPKPTVDAGTRMALLIRPLWTWRFSHLEAVAISVIPPLTLANRVWSRPRGDSR